MAISPKMQSVVLDRIFLDLQNPRHEPYENEGQVIDYLCRYENVYPLAKDIVAHGLNPLELFALIPDDAEGATNTFIVAEGNRRLCALKLLHDAERAPTKWRKAFEELAEVWSGAGDLPCAVFPDRQSVDLWLSRIHDGEQGGVGRRKWNADQSARHSGDSKNKVALAVLDYAEASGLITADARKGKLTTVQRYLVSPVVREALGVDAANPDDVSRTRSKADFDLLLGRFLTDLAANTVNSRAKKDQIEAYGRELSATPGQSHDRVAPSQSVKAQPTSGKPTAKPKRPKKSKPRRYLPYEEAIKLALDALGGMKLPHLYNSICSVALDEHAPLVSIGAWAFLESLTAKAGRNEGTPFPDFFSKQRLQGYGLPTGKNGRGIEEAIKRVATSGNVTKHDGTAALFNGEQLANDMETLKDLILKCAEEARPTTS
jgi:hypothetical protein